jgi:Flp pilus assembly protein CpaB
VGSKRMVILIAAVVVGALAAVALYSYVNGIEDRAYQGADRVSVYVVKGRISANTTGETAINQGLLVAKPVPRDLMPATAVVNPETIQAKFAKTDLEPGQIVVGSMFVDKVDTTSSWVAQLGADEVAVMINLDQVRGMAGILHPGDHVTMLVSLDGTEGQAPGSAPAAGASALGGTGPSMRFLYSNVYVLAVGATGVSTTGNDAVPAAGPITFKMPLKAAEKVMLANSKIYLVLEPANFVPKDSDVSTVVDWTQIFQGEKTPYPDQPATTTTAPAAGTNPSSKPTTTTTGATTTTKPSH